LNHGCRLTDSLTAEFQLALISAVILGSESHGTHNHILFSDGCGSLQNLTANWDHDTLIWLVASLYKLGTEYVANTTSKDSSLLFPAVA
jgi:hypothetical protein